MAVVVTVMVMVATVGGVCRGMCCLLGDGTGSGGDVLLRRDPSNGGGGGRLADAVEPQKNGDGHVRGLILLAL